MPSKSASLVVGIIAYLALVTAPPILKLAHVPPYAGCSWPQALSLVWAPWALVGACAALLFVVGLFKRRRV